MGFNVSSAVEEKKRKKNVMHLQKRGIRMIRCFHDVPHRKKHSLNLFKIQK